MHLCSLERNGDVVVMSSYAPLLCKERYSNWNPDLIYFNNDSITRFTPSYHVQRLWGNYWGDRYIASDFKIKDNLRYRVAASIVKNTKLGKTYLKLINALPAQLSLNIEGLPIPAGATYEELSGKVNEKHAKISKSKVDGPNMTLPPYTVRIIEL